MSAPSIVHVAGAGPSGTAAALAALQLEIPVRIYDQSHFPRHKVCGEFYSPEMIPVLERLKVWDSISNLRPARIRRWEIYLGKRHVEHRLAEPAFGLSRFAFDQHMLETAVNRGAEHVRERLKGGPTPLVNATGRKARVPRGRRLFGFKAHFDGPINDAVELFFFARCYVGLNAVEGGRTNVCGLGPEDLLKKWEFDYDSLVNSSEPLRARLEPLRRCFDWISTGPLVFENEFEMPCQAGIYPTGDALSFVDPFTGSGLLCAMVSGELAGNAAARGADPAAYIRQARAKIEQPFRMASLVRRAVRWPVTPWLLPLVPSGALFRLTRPAAA
jgi:flavin-dependent dehydrogenase